MASIESKSMDTPDETRTPDKTTVSVVHLGQATVARLRRSRGGGGRSASSPSSVARAARPRTWLRGLGTDPHRLD